MRIPRVHIPLPRSLSGRGSLVSGSEVGREAFAKDQQAPPTPPHPTRTQPHPTPSPVHTLSLSAFTESFTLSTIPGDSQHLYYFLHLTSDTFFPHFFLLWSNTHHVQFSILAVFE